MNRKGLIIGIGLLALLAIPGCGGSGGDGTNQGSSGGGNGDFGTPPMFPSTPTQGGGGGINPIVGPEPEIPIDDGIWGDGLALQARVLFTNRPEVQYCLTGLPEAPCDDHFLMNYLAGSVSFIEFTNRCLVFSCESYPDVTTVRPRYFLGLLENATFDSCRNVDWSPIPEDFYPNLPECSFLLDLDNAD